MLHRASTTSEADVEMALTLLLDASALLTFDAVHEFRPTLVPQVRASSARRGQLRRALPSQHRLDEASDASQVAQKVEVGMPKFALILS